MNFADKLIALRRKNGWSQEELAQRLDVTRQSVSKWEGAQSVPDLDRILALSRLFGVSTDYLLKDELDAGQACTDATRPAARRVPMEEAQAFLRVKAATARPIAFAAFLCILSPVCLMLLAAAQETRRLAVSENFAGGVGLIVMVLMAAAAVAVFLSCGAKTGRFEYLEKETLEPERGVLDMARREQEAYRARYGRNNTAGTVICILSLIPLFACAFLTEDEFFLMLSLALMMALVGVGVVFFITAGIRWASLEKLLQEGDYTVARKKRSTRAGAVSTVYWLVVTAVYLAYSFSAGDWRNGWIIWPVAGVLFAALMTLFRAFEKKPE